MHEGIGTDRCVCANLRSATRQITQFFDSFLQPSGLQTTQYSLLSTLAHLEATPITQFAQTLAMDRTTLTRNLEPLIRRGLVERSHGTDQRVRVVCITPFGRETLAVARPLWAEAQHQIVAGLGVEHYHALLAELSAVVALVR